MEMTDKEFETFEKLFNEKIQSLHSEILSGNTLILEKIDNVNNTVLKQNSRVGKLEDFKEYAQGVIDKRAIECPNIPRFTKCQEDIEKTKDEIHKSVKSLEKNLEDAMFFIRHPKLFITILVFLVIMTLATFLENNPFKSLSKELPKTEQTQVNNSN